MMHSQLPGRPSFRDSAIHSVAIVPLTIPSNANSDSADAAAGGSTTTQTHSDKSYSNLLKSLQEFAIQGRLSHQRIDNNSESDGSNPTKHNSEAASWSDESSQITVILPHSQLTRPGDWRYNTTPLKSHDWQSGCQRIRIFDGRPEYSRMAYDRLLRNNNNSSDTGEDQQEADDPWSDLEPHRTTAAIIGVLNMKDCRDTNDLWAAEKSLMEWANRYDATFMCADTTNNRGNTTTTTNSSSDANANNSNIIIRLFVFDSFEESIQQRVNISETRLSSNQIVAFPPLEMAHSQMMALHWNVVVNDLAVSLFRSVEGKIRRNDALSKSIASGNNIASTATSVGIQAAKGGVAALLNNAAAPSSSSSDQDGDDASISTNTTDANTSTGGSSHDGQQQQQRMMGLGGRFKNAFDNTRKAIANRQDSAGASYRSDSASSGGEFGGAGSAGGKLTGGSETWNTGVDKKKLVTPLDLDATVEMTTVSARDMEALKRRDRGRREKRSADLSLLAGSPIDAYERYTRAAELTRHSHDPLWYASALEGCACAFIAMAEAGGHGVDEYLENNFQLSEEIMAFAIAQGVAAGADLGDSKGKTMTVDRSKTTLPQAVTALVEEALSVLCRHEKLAPLHAGLLLKLAEYIQELEEGHLRCRWGEGEFCYGGDLNSSSGDYAPPRWEKTSVSRLTLQGAEVREMLALDSIERGRKFTELLHRAVSIGGLDDRSRADVAAACARACLKGTKTTQWGSYGGSESPSTRLRFPRKAAYFTLIAAEAMSRCKSVDAGQRASNLYVAASHLYSRKGNEEESLTKYGWATLRASALQGLSCQPADKPVAEEATELLIALLNEISPDQVDDSFLMAQLSDGSFQEVPISVVPVLDRKRSIEETNTGRPQHVSNPLASMAKTPFFSQAPPSALSLSQSKWLEDGPVPHIQLPHFNNVATSELAGADKKLEKRASALNSSLSSLSCVTNKIGFEKCARIQKLCVVNMSDLRQQMGATSSLDDETIEVYEENNSLPPPLVVTSAKIIKSESHLLLERTKAVGYSSKFATHSMSTFFNPYAKNQAAKDAKNKVQTTLLAEGEERTIMIEFKNRLAVPLEVPSCRLEFEGKDISRIEAPPLSFTVPAKTKSFAVHFPFIVSVSKTEHKEEEVKEEDESEAETIPEPDTFDVVGLCVTCLNRTFPIRFKKSEAEEDAKDKSTKCQIPPPASVYQRSIHNAPKQDEQQLVVRLESVPAQPNLLVSFAASQSPMEEDANVPVHLSDGEIFTIPPFRLENDLGKSGMGEIERLQVLAVGLPGIPDETLFDTDALAAALEEEEDVLTESDSEAEEDFEEMMECDGLPPLKMKVIAEGLDLKSINDKTRNKGEGSIVKFQMAATHDMGDQLANGGNVRIRFRYRGPSPNPATEIWRKREISLRIIRVKGPRISSLTFRSDLSWGSSYSELCNSLARQRSRLDAIPKWESSNTKHRLQSRSHSFGSSSMGALSTDMTSSDAAEDSILNRVGMDNGVHVSADEVVLLMAVANETNSTIILSNKKGLVGGFEGSPMPTVKVTSGVSVKIPVVIPRIDRIDENGEVTDIAAELVSRTALQWESQVVEEGDDNSEKIKRTGRVRIPSRCLREIIDEHQSFASRICKPPVSLRVSIGEDAKSEVSMKIGEPVQVNTNLNVLDWVPKDVVAKSKVTLEFCCAEKQPGNNSSTSGRMPYVWCGQLRRTIDLSNDDDDKSHSARIAFFQSGVYVVSACAKISSHDTPGVEEFWWAPHATIIKVNEEVQ